MSILASINLEFVAPIQPWPLLQALLSCGWWTDDKAAFHVVGPDGFDNMDDQLLTPADKPTLQRWASGLVDTSRGFQVVLKHFPSGLGGGFLVFQGWKSVSWVISINQPRIGTSRLVDFTRCLKVVWPAIESTGWHVSQVTCDQST